MPLSELATRCEEAKRPDYQLDCAIMDALNPHLPKLEPRQFTVSIDAAITLVPEGQQGALDPHFMDEEGVVRFKAYCFRPLWSRWTPHSDWVEKVSESALSATPALALCAAALRAIAAGTRSAEITEELAPSEGCQSGGCETAASPNPCPHNKSGIK